MFLLHSGPSIVQVVQVWSHLGLGLQKVNACLGCFQTVATKDFITGHLNWICCGFESACMLHPKKGIRMD